MKALVFIPFLVMGLNIGGSAQTTINLPAAQNCAPAVPADTDSDGIADNIDACPSVAGVLALKGCPVPAGTSGQAYSFDCDHAGTKVVDVTLSDGSVWMDRNMGALRQATDELDLFAAGCLYQYGRKPDGHQVTHYVQPKNWLNGYPTAGNVLGTNASLGAGAPQAQGYSINPGVGDIPYGTNTGILNGSIIWNGTSPATTYNVTAGSAGDLTPGSPLDSGVPARTNTGTKLSYSNYSWWSDEANYPTISTMQQLWGGNETAQTTNAATAVALLQPWGQELNPVCPTGYHVPTMQEWYSALRSIAVTDAYTGQWGKSKLHLSAGFNNLGSATYWTSTRAIVLAVPAYQTVYLDTDNTQNNLDRAQAGSTNVLNGVVNGSVYPIAYRQITTNLFVRCKKN